MTKQLLTKASPMLVWSILALILIIILMNEFSNFRTGVPTIASFPASRRKMVEILQADCATHTGSDPYTVIDLGSGHGQLAVKIARALPNAKVLGIEISFLPWLMSFVRQKFFGPHNVTFRRTDFFSYDCSKTDAVVLYTNSTIIDRVSQKLRAELKPNALVASNEIKLTGDWEPVEAVDTGFFKMKVFVYRQ